MFLERYEYQKGKSPNQFYFYSNGPKGRILKAVSYKLLGKSDDVFYFNVGFGDADQKTGVVNDLVVSNNMDREKILATVAATAVEFTRRNRKCRLIIMGRTPGRARLYQMKIGAYYSEISELFDIQGQTKTGWEPFQKGKNYLRFMFERIKFEVWEL